MSKKILLKDDYTFNDFADVSNGNNKGTEIIITDAITGKVLQRIHNKVNISGAIYNAVKQFNITSQVVLPSYNKSMSLDNSVYTAPTNTEICCLYGCGTNGCGTDSSIVYPVNYTKRIQPSELVPFVYNTDGSDIADAYKQTYYGKKTLLDGTVAYYFKAFDTTPVLNVRYSDGTVVDDTIYNPNNTKSAETYVELILRISKSDFRDYFIANNSLDSARINSLSLMTGWYTESKGIKTFQNILPMTELHFANISLSDASVAIDITYHIFY